MLSFHSCSSPNLYGMVWRFHFLSVFYSHSLRTSHFFPLGGIHRLRSIELANILEIILVQPHFVGNR